MSSESVRIPFETAKQNLHSANLLVSIQAQTYIDMSNRYDDMVRRYGTRDCKRMRKVLERIEDDCRKAENKASYWAEIVRQQLGGNEL